MDVGPGVAGSQHETVSDLRMGKSLETYKVKLFGNLAEALNADEVTVSAGNDTDHLQRVLLDTFPVLQSFRFALAVNRRVVNKPESIHPGDEIALLPPFSGG